MKFVFRCLIIFELIVFSNRLFAQCNGIGQTIIQNPSFEGTPGYNVAPPSWISCQPGYSPSTLDGYNTPFFCADENVTPYNGNTYLGLYYSSSSGAQGVSQHLNVPLVAGITYTLTIELTNFVKCGQCSGCQIWGGFDTCDLNTLLWSSGPIQAGQWNFNSFTFTPAQNFTYITILIYNSWAAGGPDCYGQGFYTGVDDITLQRDSFPLSASVQLNSNILCAGDSDGGMATAHAIGSYPVFHYIWSSNPPQTDSVLQNVPAGTYTVTVTDADSFCTTASVSISHTPSLSPYPPVASTTSCFSSGNGIINFNGNGGTPPYHFHWSNADTTANIGNLFSGTYTVTVTDSNGCTATTSITIDSVPPLIITGNVNNASCQSSDGYITASASGGKYPYYYVWSTSPQQTGVSAFNLSSGTYTVTVSDAHNCTASKSFNVSSGNISVTLTPVNSGSCSGQSNSGSVSSSVSGGTAPYSYHWNNGDSTANISNLDPGNYTLTLTDADGCQAINSVTINASSGITLNVASINTTCGANNGSVSVSITGGTPPFSYHWSNAGVADTISNLSAGTYKVTVSDIHNCSATASVVISPSGAGSVTITSNKIIMCSGDSAQVCAPSGHASYLWNTGSNSPCIDVQSAGNYYLTVTDAGGCTATSNHLAINVYPNPPVQISANGDTLASYNAVTYQWYLNGIAISGGTMGTYIATQSGSYTVVVSDTNGCPETSSPYPLTLTAIEELNDDEWVKVYPNPLSAGSWQLEVGGDLIGSMIEIFDDNGRLVYKSQITNYKSPLDFDAPGGVYLMRIFSKQRNVNMKLVRL